MIQTRKNTPNALGSMSETQANAATESAIDKHHVRCFLNCYNSFYHKIFTEITAKEYVNITRGLIAASASEGVLQIKNEQGSRQSIYEAIDHLCRD
jgi:hypothetical protein